MRARSTLQRGTVRAGSILGVCVVALVAGAVPAAGVANPPSAGVPNAAAAGVANAAAGVTSAAAGVTDANVVALRVACARGDAHELARVADRLGARGLASACGSADRADVLAAVTAAPLATPAWAVLDPLTELLASHDRPIAAAAARAIVTIVRDLVRTPEQLTASGAPIDELVRAADTCTAVATNPGVWPDVRVHALECVLGLAAGLGEDTPPAARALPASLFTDPDAEVRRAAVALADADADDGSEPGDALLAALAAVAADDLDAAVAATAAATLCRAGRSLPTAALERARRLAADPIVDPGDAVSLRRCTRAAR